MLYGDRAADAAGAATRNVSGTMTGPGAFEPKGCGVISVVGHGTYTSTGLGQGTYVYDACVLSTSPFDFEGTVTFTRRTGATLTGTIDGTVPGAHAAELRRHRHRRHPAVRARAR